jgi:hypothetical protein
MQLCCQHSSVPCNWGHARTGKAQEKEQQKEKELEQEKEREKVKVIPGCTGRRAQRSLTGG